MRFLAIVGAVAAALVLTGIVPLPVARDAAGAAWSGVSGFTSSIVHAVRKDQP